MLCGLVRGRWFLPLSSTHRPNPLFLLPLFLLVMLPLLLPLLILVLLPRIQAWVEQLMEELLEEWLLALARRPLGAQFSAAGMCVLAIEQLLERLMYERRPVIPLRPTSRKFAFAALHVWAPPPYQLVPFRSSGNGWWQPWCMA